MPAARAPTLAEYTRFHGMVARPSVARRCVDSFHNGVVVFTPSSVFTPVASESINAATAFPTTDGVISRYEVVGLTVFKYYALVLYSLTGLCTALGLTRTIDAREDLLNGLPALNGEAESRVAAHPLHPSPAILEYVSRRSGSPSLTVVRRFEFDFKLVGLRVVMLHLRGARPPATADSCGLSPEPLHLIEVYELARGVRLAVGAAMVMSASWALVRGLLYRARSLIAFSSRTA